MSYFFDEEIDFLQAASWRRMIITSFAKNISANPEMKEFFTQKHLIISKENENQPKKEQEKQEKNFEDKKTAKKL